MNIRQLNRIRRALDDAAVHFLDGHLFAALAAFALLVFIIEVSR